jgi:zinc/manganese transport system substrate-binding protein
MHSIRYLSLIFLLLFVIPAAATLDVVSTTTVLWDPIQYIGGEKVEAIYIADPTICPHMQSDIIPNRIQLEREFIQNADLFIAHNGSVDQAYVMPYVSDFMEANDYGTVNWITLANPSMTWNTPSTARELSCEVAGWLIEADPANSSYYEERLDDYLAEIDAADLSAEERDRIGGQKTVVMIWQKEAAEDWLGLDVVTVFAPDFYQNGQYTPRAVVNDIYNDAEKFSSVAYVIENMQSGEMAKGVEEALADQQVSVKRVIFTNFPKSIAGVDSIPDVLRYNKGLVTPPGDSPAATASTPSSPVSIWVIPLGVAVGAFLFTWLRR